MTVDIGWVVAAFLAGGIVGFVIACWAAAK